MELVLIAIGIGALAAVLRYLLPSGSDRQVPKREAAVLGTLILAITAALAAALLFLAGNILLGSLALLTVVGAVGFGIRLSLGSPQYRR